ncbi:MAG: hypothetical protein K6C12_09505 [Oscillospiraceae bacterium]|nr:hypothetical protein [Oscillospiraceae bacterium]
MVREYRVPASLNMLGTFSRNDFVKAFKEEHPDHSDEAAVYSLRKLQSDKKIRRIGWNQYTASGEKRIYHHNYSEISEEVAELIQKEYVDPVFQIFELTQLNDFVNHQIAHNTVFVYVENELIDFVFDTLKRSYPGKVMLKPSVKEYYRYLVDDEIVVGRLPSESPKSQDTPWHSRLEKILVDVAVDKLLSSVVLSGEYKNIFNESFEQYYIDFAAMVRYAKRKGAERKFETFLETHGLQKAGA